MGNTAIDLVAELERLPQNPGRDYVLEQARAGAYHSYNTEVPAPKLLLALDLRDYGYEALARRVEAGEFDEEQPTPEQLEELRRTLGLQVFEAVVGKKGTDDGQGGG
jgi:hypothetical protein